ncbi:phosphoglycerate mutase-like protein [Sistotremastrum niveocremeum HHB9708]|uniref:Phosphoglycerate mutase-like protein n=2 Tax=Sistotremastraceae TaxID=3402574 RepID=A0A164XG96_9AGAM|nr:phosphoglycerate mutase-like protein [Sistotremastrum niveocremeum HHB9708]KZT41329.1 phosphoglycerate mutase-like protein [Sistotremastrum suecicum HHB10207 ss-3]
MASGEPRLLLIRHGQTEWSVNGRHTGVTDIPLTPKGVQLIQDRADKLVGPAKLLDPANMCHILISPRRRAHETFHLLFGDESQAPSHEITNDVREWDYGEYEGLTTKEIVKGRPGWDIFKDGCPGGESTEEVTERIDRVISKVQEIHRQYKEEGKGRRDVMIVAHGHFTRCLVARWIKAPIILGQGINVEPAGIALLTYNHHSLDEPAITGLNLHAY